MIEALWWLGATGAGYAVAQAVMEMIRRAR